MLRNLESRFAKLETYKGQLSSSDYSWSRDDDANLYVNFPDKKIAKIPVIDLRPYQIAKQKKLFVEKFRYFYYWWPRRHGKEVFSWECIVQAAITTPGLYLMIYPTNVRARMVLWDGSIVLPNGRGFKFLDMIPKKFLLGKPNNQEMTVKLINGSVIKILGADIDPDKLRGTNPRGVVLSEFAFSDPRVLAILMPILRQNMGWIMLQTTPNGMNHAYDYMQQVRNNPEWCTAIETVETLIDEAGNRYVTDEMLDAELQSGMPPWMIRQEYYCEVETNSELFYFSKEMAYLNANQKIVDDLFLPSRPVYAAFDIGWNDNAAMTLFQIDNNYNPVVIYYMEKNNETFEYYITKAKEFCTQRNLFFSKAFAPHDGENKNFNTGKNTVDVGRDIGVIVEVVLRPPSHAMAIQSIRRMLPRVRFSGNQTERLRQCLQNYQKEFDDKKGIYKKEPLHNWASHGVKSFQTLAFAMDEEKVNEVSMEVRYYHT